MASTISPFAKSGFSSASAYDTHRPSYPGKAVSSFLSALKLKGIKGGRIIELGAGTGKFTQILAEQEEGYEILAVEPHEAMRSELVEKRIKGVQVKHGAAERIDAGYASADAVICAQAFHWFATSDVLEEIHKALVPGGSLGMIWNVEDYNAPKSWTPSTQWEAKVKDITWSFDDSQPRFRHERWREVFEEQLSSTPFGIQSTNPLFSLPLGENSEAFTYWLSPEAVWKRYHSLSQISVLQGEVLANTRSRVFEALKGDDVEKNEQGEVALHGRTVWAWTTAVPGGQYCYFI